MIGCYLWCKDTNFNANHNVLVQRGGFQSVVIYGAKILILMQITTNWYDKIQSAKLLFMVQRY